MGLVHDLYSRMLNSYFKYSGKYVVRSVLVNDDVQYPLPSDGDSVYAKDVNVDLSTAVGWTDKDNQGVDKVLIPFTDLQTRLHNATSDNPKVLLIHFNRTINAHQVGLGSVGDDESFSNVRITLLGSDNVERTVLDDCSNDTKFSSRNYEFEPQLFNALKLEFCTADSVCVSNITIQKACEVSSYIKVQKPNGTIVNAQGTTRGNFKISLEEFDDAVKGQQLQADSLSVNPAVEFYDELSRTQTNIDVEHSAIHNGTHFNYADYQLDNDSGSTIIFTFTTLDNEELTHFLFMACSSLGATLEIYEGSTGVSGGEVIVPRNNNRISLNTSNVSILKDPTITSFGTRAQGFLLGGDRQSGNIKRENEYVLKPNTTYSMVITSLVNNCNIGWNAEWYEYVGYSNV